ncbi:hypothetical protein CXP39_00965 [Mesoplasma syrphidae]|uniref:Uncharacterized protein n=1 Tax=Mesoplasma syrphidae TaxID=225999 RepID=A0A2K9BJA1_9MOLU|nr:hypothetical protein [Mesoplasma syrphidae]AUF83376.1 hypothetical protein CXP39_00965 [Mesoplasma syrphidae]
MFNGKLKAEDGAIVIILIIFISLLILLMIVGKLIIFVFGKISKSALSGEEVLKRLKQSRGQDKLTIQITKLNFLTALFRYKRRTDTLQVSQANFKQANLKGIFEILNAFDQMEEYKINSKESSWQLKGLVGLFGLGIATLIAVVLIIIFVPHENNPNKVNTAIPFGWAFALEVLSVFGWMISVLVFLWWMNIIQNKKTNLLELAKPILTKTEYIKFRKLLSIWLCIPMSSRILI